MERKDQPGFTLIELLIVLAVIAVLTAILFPEFAQTRETARQGSCLSNLHQIAIANELYTQDYDGAFLWNPPGEGASGEVAAARIRRQTGQQRLCADHPRAPWTMLLQPYLKSCEVLRCPSFPGEQSRSEAPEPPGGSGGGYGLNAVLLGDDCQPRTVTSVHHSPSGVALIGDSALPRSDIWLEHATTVPGPHGWGGGVLLQAWNEWPGALPPTARLYWGWQTNHALAPRWRPDLHGGGSNFAFADGHARFLRPAAAVVSLPPPPQGTAVLDPSAEDKAGAFPDALLD